MFVTIKVKDNRKVKPEINFGRRVGRAMITTANRIAEKSLHISREYYMEQRKTKEMPSVIFGNFAYKTDITGINKVTAIVFVNESRAPHAIYVDQDRKLRNGKTWKGYHFMEKGGKEASKLIEKYAYEDLRKQGIGV